MPYHVKVITSSPGIPSDNNNNTFGYLIGSDLNLTCLVTPTPPAGSEFSWNCSTGCFADMGMEQTINVINLTSMDSGSITCSFTVSGLDYHSEPLNLLVSG